MSPLSVSVRAARRTLKRTRRSGQLIARALRGERRLFLTFDDGPTDYTGAILDLLAEYRAKATFFVIGQSVADDRMPVLQRVLLEGHAVGSHTWSHANLATCEPERIKDEIRRADQVLTSVFANAGLDPQTQPRFFRFPYLRQGNPMQRGTAHRVLRELGYQVFFCEVDTKDWKLPLGEVTMDEVERRALLSRAYDVVLLHDTEHAVGLLQRLVPVLGGKYELCSLEDWHGRRRAPDRVADPAAGSG